MSGNSDTQYQRSAATRLGIAPEEYAAHRAAGERWCSGCRAWLALAAFALNGNNADGYQSRCRACKKVYDAAYQKRRSAGTITPRPPRNPSPWRPAARTTHQEPPAPPGDAETPTHAPTPAAAPPSRVAAIAAEWDAAAAKRTRERQLRRAERRRTA